MKKRLERAGNRLRKDKREGDHAEQHRANDGEPMIDRRPGKPGKQQTEHRRPADTPAQQRIDPEPPGFPPDFPVGDSVGVLTPVMTWLPDVQGGEPVSDTRSARRPYKCR